MDGPGELLGCAGFLIFLIAVGLILAMWARLGELVKRVQYIETQLADIRREKLRQRAIEEEAGAVDSITRSTPEGMIATRLAIGVKARQRMKEFLQKRQEEMRLKEETRAAARAAARAAQHIPPPPAPQAIPQPTQPEPPPEPVLPPPRLFPPPPPKVDAPIQGGLEDYLGTKAFVVIGAIALALAVIFLVKIGIERHIFSPAARVIAGLVAGLTLLTLAQWRRKRETFLAQGLSAAGIVALFAAIYAATMVYHFLLPVQGFVGLACVTAAAVTLSLQRPGGGMLIATLGLIGGFITPLLVRTDEPHATALFGYLLLLHVGLTTATRIRGWAILAALCTLLSSLWLIGWTTSQPWKPQDSPVLGAFLLASVASMVVGSLRRQERWGAGGLWARALTWLSASLGLLAACVLLGRSGYSNLEWSYFALLTAGAFILARLRRGYEGLAWFSSLAILAMMVAWAGIGHQAIAPGDFARLCGWMIGLGTASVLAAYGCQWGSRSPLRWACLTTLLTWAYVAAAYGILGSDPWPKAWGWLPAAAALVIALLTLPVYLRRHRMRTGEQTLAVYAHGILGLLTMAAPMVWRDGPLNAAWATLLPLTALAVWTLKIPRLVVGLFLMIGLLTIRGLLFSGWSATDFYPLAHGTLLWNPVVWTYASIALAMILSVWLIERAAAWPPEIQETVPGPLLVSSILQTGAAIAGFFLLTLEVRWYFHDGKLNDWTAALAERGAFATGWLLLACALLWVGTHMKRDVLVRCGEVIGGLALFYAVSVLVLLTNPLWWGDNVGNHLVFNELLTAYGPPALLCGLLAYLLANKVDFAPAAGIVGIILLITLVSLEVRQGFQGPHLNGLGTSFLENGTYTVTWMVLSGLLLAAGLRWKYSTVVKMGLIVAALALFFAAGVSGALMNPLWTHASVGSLPVFNWLLYVYGLPALGAAWLAWGLGQRGEDPREWGRASAIIGFWLAFVLVTLEVQQYFRGEFLSTGAGPSGEMAAYSLSWAALGGIYLFAGVWRQSMLLRSASLVMMLLTVGKVFMLDLADLKDLERVFSFAGLGISLMALAFVYQRFVFRRTPEPAAPQGGAV